MSYIRKQAREMALPSFIWIISPCLTGYLVRLSSLIHIVAYIGNLTRCLPGTRLVCSGHASRLIRLAGARDVMPRTCIITEDLP